MYSQVKYALTCIKELLVKKGLDTVEPTSDAQLVYMKQLKTDLKSSVWNTSCNSWYKNDSGEITSLYPNTVSRFRWTLEKFNMEDYAQ
jgi:hypothetical protein